MTIQQHSRRVPLSVLDLAILRDGGTSAEALADTTALAQHAETLGFTRFWVAEHHNMPSVASTTPPVLIAHLAANTSTIHVGSGGVMLPNHPPLVVAEQFALLEALHPGRIDLGIGRAPGTDPRTAAALRRTAGALSVDEFPEHVIDLMGMLGDVRTSDGLWTQFAATPAPTTVPTIVLLGSSDYSARLAGQLGLPFAFANHFDTGGTLLALQAYRDHFEPSPVLKSPYAIVTASVLVADTEEEAATLAAPGQLMIYGIRTGRFIPLMPPQQALDHPQLAAARGLRSNRIIGTSTSAVQQLERLIIQSNASEIMVVTQAYSLTDRKRSLQLLMEAWKTTFSTESVADHG